MVIFSSVLALSQSKGHDGMRHKMMKVHQLCITLMLDVPKTSVVLIHNLQQEETQCVDALPLASSKCLPGSCLRGPHIDRIPQTAIDRSFRGIKHRERQQK